MDWFITFVTLLAIFALASPLLMLLATVFILVPLAHLAPRPPMIARSTFDCPISRRRVNAEFSTTPDLDRPSDVLACSAFPSGPVLCKKGCLAVAVTRWAPSPAVPRYALIADGTSYR
jgi:hypothetical protein